MMVLGYYHSMMLRGDQCLYEYEVITIAKLIAQRLLLADIANVAELHNCIYYIC
jgi:hypothetical protein